MLFVRPKKLYYVLLYKPRTFPDGGWSNFTCYYTNREPFPTVVGLTLLQHHILVKHGTTLRN